MNLLNSLFNVDDIEIKKLNKKYLWVLVFFLIMILLLLFIEKDNYYAGTFTVSNEKIVLLVEKNYVNNITSNNKIIIDGIENSYSIRSIDVIDNVSMVNIKTDIKIKNISSGTYKVYLGKERLFEYIIRIINNQ